MYKISYVFTEMGVPAGCIKSVVLTEVGVPAGCMKSVMSLQRWGYLQGV